MEFLGPSALRPRSAHLRVLRLEEMPPSHAGASSLAERGTLLTKGSIEVSLVLHVPRLTGRRTMNLEECQLALGALHKLAKGA
eukprot:26002-Lingulodinium_polyedra.AAC.1